MKAIDTEGRSSLLFIQTQFWSITGSLAALQRIYKANTDLNAKDTNGSLWSSNESGNFLYFFLTGIVSTT